MIHESHAERAAEAQAKYCEAHELPQFAPINGLCPRCGRNIYRASGNENGKRAGISVGEAASRLITGCPHCGASFCD